MVKKFFVLFILFFFCSLVGAERILNLAFEIENVSERDLLFTGGKGVITIPGRVEQKILESSNEVIFSKSTRAFLKCSFSPSNFLFISGRVGFTNFDWEMTIINPPGSPGESQNAKFKGRVSLVWGLGARVKIFEVAGIRTEICGDFLSSSLDGKYYIDDIEFKEFEEEQFRIQHGGGEVRYKIETVANEISTGILLSKKIGKFTPYIGGGYIKIKPKSTMIMEGTPADFGYVRYDLEFDSELKDKIYLMIGLNLKLWNSFNLNLALKTKAISSVAASLIFSL